MVKIKLLILNITILILFSGCFGHDMKVMQPKGDKDQQTFQLHGIIINKLTLNSCGELIKNNRNELAHIRQLFVGFNHFELVKIPQDINLNLENSNLVAVKARLDNDSISALILSTRSENCLYEKIFWVSPDNKKLFEKETIRQIINSELRS